MMGFYKDGKWQPDAAEIASGEYMSHESEMSILRGRIAELEDENNRIRIERSEFATAMDYRDKAAQREIDSLAVMGAEMQDIINTQSAQLEAVKKLPIRIGPFTAEPESEWVPKEHIDAALEQKDE
jgi:hypothetical protein